MWQPNKQGVEELLKLFREARGKNNAKHRDIYEKINEYAKNKEFSNYLIHILNDDQLEEDIRQLSGLTLKGIMERSFVDMQEEEITFFKNNIFKCYLDKNSNIRKTVSNLLNTFIRNGGFEKWPEIIEILCQNLNSDIAVSMSLETLNLIIEDSGLSIEESYGSLMEDLTIKLTSFLDTMLCESEQDRSEKLINLVLTTLYILLENCPEAIMKTIDTMANSLNKLKSCKNFSIRFRIGRCWLSIIKLRRDIFFAYFETLFLFFSENLSVEYYEMNFTASEFYLHIIEEDKGRLLKNETILENLKGNLTNVLPFFLHFTRLTQNDLYGAEIENKQYNKHSKSDNRNSANKKDNEEGDTTNYFEEDFDEDNMEMYNPNWTLRKCCSKVLDKLSNLFPETVITVLRPYLENDLQSKEWITKERSILALGAIGVGSYEYLKPNLASLLTFLISQLAHSHKLIKAITCWALSRFSQFIFIGNDSENSEELIKSYLSTLLERLLEKEPIVQEAACTAFITAITTKKDKLSPYFFDIIKIVNMALKFYKGNSLLTLYDTIIILTENFDTEFTNLEAVHELVSNILKKWYELLNLTPEELYTNQANMTVFDLTCSIIKVSGPLIKDFFNDFITGAMRIIEKNFNDKEITSKCLEIISSLCQGLPDMVRECNEKYKIVSIIFKLHEQYNHDSYLKQYLLPLIGDICSVDPKLLESNIDYFLNILINDLDVPDVDKKAKLDLEKISVCNNSCWTLGLIAQSFSDKITLRANDIMKKIIKIYSFPKLNKSLAQNISICIGRLALICPEIIANYLEMFIKQFCLSLKSAPHSEEKEEAFNGICQAIIRNPQGILNQFAFFCDAICCYSDATSCLESLFHNIILSYVNLLAENWENYFALFPDKLKTKLSHRFSIA